MIYIFIYIIFVLAVLNACRNIGYRNKAYNKALKKWTYHNTALPTGTMLHG